MYKFFKEKEWRLWSWAGLALIVFSLWYQVSVNVRINEWFGDFYGLIGLILKDDPSVRPEQYWSLMWTFGTIAGVYIIVSVLTDFFTQHYLFRWRTSMANYYMKHWDTLRLVEGASQRVQEDTIKFAKLMETLGTGLIEAVMTLAAFVPILWGLSKFITVVPIFGDVPHVLVIGAISFALVGTVGLGVLGMKLPGLEYNNQVVEAALRKELVWGEDNSGPPRFNELWIPLRGNYFKLYFHYMYFGLGKWSYLQFGVLVPYLLMGSSILAGLLTLGIIQQTVRAFGQVETSLQYLVRSWTTVVELLSVRKRLLEFERTIQ
jgi:peptide/bleomycin uptake transporter